MQIIEIERLSRDYGEGRGIFDISFSIAEGEVFGFLGPNGAGKTTTIRHLLGFLKAKQGSAKILGMDCWKQSDAITRQLGYIPGGRTADGHRSCWSALSCGQPGPYVA